VSGEAGIGKSRLLHEVAAYAGDLGWAVLVGRCSPTSALGFGVITEALRSWLRQHPVTASERLRPFAAGLRLALPEWEYDGGSSGLNDVQLRLLAFEGLVQLVGSLAESAPGALVVLDDLHAADADSMEAIRYLVGARVPAVRVIGALRPEEGQASGGLVRLLEQDGVAEVMGLGPLDDTCVAMLVRSLLGEQPPDELVASIVRRTDGVPLFVEELVAAYAAGDGTVPLSVVKAVGSRLDGLGRMERRVIDAAATLDSFDPPLLAWVAEADDVARATAAAADVGVVEFGNGTIGFRHTIVREAVVAGTNPLDVWTFHRRAAEFLSNARSDDMVALEQRAYHLREIAEHNAAAALLVELTSRRLAGHAVLGAEDSARQACDAARSAASRDVAEDALARVLVAQSRWDEALAIDQRAGSATTARILRMARCALETSRTGMARELLERARAAPDVGAQLLVLEGHHALLTGNMTQAIEHSRAAQQAASEAADVCAGIDLEARALDFAGQRDEAIAAYRRLVRSATTAGLVAWRIRALVELGAFELLMGQPPQFMLAARDAALDAGALVEWGWAEFNLANAVSLQGDLRRGVAIAAEATERARALRLDVLPFLILVRAAGCALLECDDPETLFTEAADLAGDNTEFTIGINGIRGYIAAQHGQYADAITAADVAVSLYRGTPGGLPMDTPFWRLLALCADGRDDEARRSLREVQSWPGLERWHARRFLTRAASAIIARDAGRLDTAIAELPGRQPMDVALAQVIAAQVIGGEQRIRWLSDALRFYESAGFGPATTDRIRKLLRDAGGAVPRRKRESTSLPPDLKGKGITDRELEVLVLISDGSPNAVIAQRLYLSVRTVESHVSSLLRKLNMKTRNQLIAFSARLASSRPPLKR
jgi:DNA-binding CsgD family transcriptional regulator/tetratricopeptide (TPR) repeat protein